jgi:hypothetical protein
MCFGGGWFRVHLIAFGSLLMLMSSIVSFCVFSFYSTAYQDMLMS